MELKGRLKAIADMVPVCSSVADVGTDHAYIPIYLVQKGKCERAAAVDIKPGPLRIAERNIRSCNLSGIIETRLGYGLEPVSADEAEVVIVSGMGGMLICEILDRAGEKARRASCLVLQPMNAVEMVREWLYRRGFAIFSEALVEEYGKIYVVMGARWTGEITEEDEIFYHIGKRLVENHDQLLKKYLARKIKRIDRILTGLEKAADKQAETEKYKALKERMTGILEKIKERC